MVTIVFKLLPFNAPLVNPIWCCRRWVRQLHPIEDPPLRLPLPARGLPILAAEQPPRYDINLVFVEPVVVDFGQLVNASPSPCWPWGLVGQGRLQWYALLIHKWYFASTINNLQLLWSPAFVSADNVDIVSPQCQGGDGWWFSYCRKIYMLDHSIWQ